MKDRKEILSSCVQFCTGETYVALLDTTRRPVNPIKESSSMIGYVVRVCVVEVVRVREDTIRTLKNDGNRTKMRTQLVVPRWD